LYVSRNAYTISDASLLLQFDLTAANIFATKQIIDTVQFPYYSGGEVRLAIDDKIYWANAWDDGNWNFPYPDSAYYLWNMNLGVVNNPNNLGSSCNFQRFSFYLGGKRTYWGLPNNPNYDMLALGGSPCDTLGYPNTIQLLSEDPTRFNIFYHS